MIGRKRQVEEDVHKDRWMVSYADFVTLLFAFFVVMYSVSSVNEGKFRVLSDSLLTAFSVDNRTLEPIQVGELRRGTGPEAVQVIKRSEIADRVGFPASSASKRVGEIEDAGDKPMKILFEGLRASVATLSDRDLVKVHNNDFGVEIEISTSVLFKSGGTVLEEQSTPVLRRLASVLKPFPHDINVQGYTDNIPIQGNAFPSNWELSAARAASVVQLFARLGIQENRLSATGYGEFRPIADNATREGRSKNRRVIIFVPSYKDKQSVIDAVNRLGSELDRGIVMDRSVTGNNREEFKTIINEPAPPIIEAPVNESRFFNPAPVAGVRQAEAENEVDLAPASARPTGSQQAIGASDDARHIAREPIEGTSPGALEQRQ